MGTSPAVHPLYKVVCDDRFPQSVAFGHAAERLGAALVPIHGDMTDFWFTDLSLRWKKDPVPVAGLTAHGPAFCLERLAWDHGMRMVFRGEHRMLVSRVVHSLSGPRTTIDRAQALATGTPRWGESLAALVTTCATETVTASAEIIAPADPSALPDAELLVSWVIAPISRG